MAEMWYDEEADTIGIMLKDKTHWKGVEISKHVVVDLAKDGEIVGIENPGGQGGIQEGRTVDSLEGDEGGSLSS